jgi:hypothetical protein
MCRPHRAPLRSRLNRRPTSSSPPQNHGFRPIRAAVRAINPAVFPTEAKCSSGRDEHSRYPRFSGGCYWENQIRRFHNDQILRLIWILRLNPSSVKKKLRLSLSSCNCMKQNTVTAATRFCKVVENTWIAPSAGPRFFSNLETPLTLRKPDNGGMAKLFTCASPGSRWCKTCIPLRALGFVWE